MITPGAGVVIAGRYTLVRPLASGGMGSVWIARDRELEIDVTAKFMAPALVASADARTRFEREAKVAARLRSQHVVQVLGYGVENDTPYIMMELLQGQSLWERLSLQGRLPVPVVARLAVQMCRALRTAHEAGLVHRDLKPGNVFLALKDDEEVVKILDFGIAKATGTGDATIETQTGMLLGSAHYMSPEQIRSSRDVDHRSDLWSVGVILFRLLTGKLPFPGTVIGDVLVRVCTEPRPALASVAPDLPMWIEDFFDRALARDPEKRFQSAVELASAFSDGALGAPSLPPSRPPARWNKTVPMGPKPGAGGPDEVTKEGTTQKRREPPPSRARPALASGADAPTLGVPPVSEAKTEDLHPATPVRESRVEPEQRTEAPAVVDKRAPVRPLWPLWALGVGVTVIGILVVALRSGTTAPNLDAARPASASALPGATLAAPSATLAAPSAMVVVEPATSVDGGAPAADSSGSARPPALPLIKDDPYSAVGKLQTTGQKPRREPVNPAPRGTTAPTAIPTQPSTPVGPPKPTGDPLNRPND